MASFVDVCRFTAASNGTGNFVVSAAVTGYQTPALAGAVNAATYRYRAESASLTEWEIGFGAYTVGTVTLARTTVLYNSAGTGTGAGQSGAGTKISFTAAPQVAIVDLAEDMGPLTLANATLQTSPANPTGTTSATQVMMGLGSTCTLTPVYSTRIHLMFQGSLNNAVTAAGSTTQARFGTGTAPTNGAAATGTTVGNTVISAVNPAAYLVPFSAGGIITGLTVGTAYWFDLGLSGTSGASLTNLSFSAFEF